ncbi:MAG: radical SAM protein [archaeon]
MTMEDADEHTAGISLTEACNMACEHCYIGRKIFWRKTHYGVKSISFDQFKQLLPQLIEAHVTRVNLGGGEPPLHPHFIDIVHMLYDAGIKVALVTNGSKMKILRGHLRLFNDIGVSIDYPDDRHSDNRRRAGAFAEAVAALEELVSSGEVKTEMVTCIMHQNYRDLPQLYVLAKSLNVDMWRLNRFHPTKNDLTRFSADVTGLDEVMDVSYLACTPEEMREAFLFLASVTNASRQYTVSDPVFRTLIVGKGVVPGTPYGKLSFRIKSDGGVVSNIFTDAVKGNVFHMRLKDILALPSPAYAPGGKCKACCNVAHCGGGDDTDRYLFSSSHDPYCFLDPSERKQVSFVPLHETQFVHESYLSTIYVPIAFEVRTC